MTEPTGMQHLAEAIIAPDVGIPELFSAIHQKCAIEGVRPSGTLKAILADFEREKSEIIAWWARVKANRIRKEANE